MTTENKNIDNFSPKHFGFLILPGFSLTAYAAAIDCLRIANSILGREIYTWKTITSKDILVKASNDIEIRSDRDLSGVEKYEIIFTCGGGKISAVWSNNIGVWLRQQNQKGVALGAICTGTYILAKAGLLNDYRCTIHWGNMSSIREEFPRIQLTNNVYEIDRDRYTCAGGTTVIDMMNHIISLQNGRSLAAAVSDELLVDHLRSMSDCQRIPLLKKIGPGKPKLIEAVMLMEANIEDPLSPDELCSLIEIGRRQLERLFRNNLNCTLTQYYLDLRLKNARRLLVQTEKSIMDISLACGFSRGTHFSKCYRDTFGLAPRDERRFVLRSVNTHQ